MIFVSWEISKLGLQNRSESDVLFGAGADDLILLQKHGRAEFELMQQSGRRPTNPDCSDNFK